MARFNIETRIFKEQGFQDLMIAVGSRHMAKGIVWELFETAQEYWFPDQKLIPLEVFKAKGLPAVLYAPGGLAELRPDGVYVRGSKAAFQWLFDAQEAGKKSGESRRKKKADGEKPKKPKKNSKKEQNEPTLNDLQGSLKVSQPTLNNPEGVSTSLLSSLSSSLSSHNSELSFQDVCEGGPQADPPPLSPKKDSTPTALVWRAYKAAYCERYGVEPTWNAQVAGKLKNFVARVPVDEAPEIAAFYVRHNGSRYVGSGHAAGPLLFDAEKLRTEWLSGRKITSHDIRTADSGDALRSQMERLQRGGK